MRTEIRNLTIEECLSSLGGAGGERKVVTTQHPYGHE